MGMRRGAVVVGIAVVVFVAGASRPGVQANGQSKKNRGCGNATITGTYGIQISGTRPSAPGGPIESVIGVVIRHYDGQGQFTQVDNVKGSITGMVPDRPGFGTYQVAEDCSAVAQFQPAPGVLIEERLMIVDDGNEIRSMASLPPPVMVTGVHKRIVTR
jgi:hypothetical protein